MNKSSCLFNVVADVIAKLTNSNQGGIRATCKKCGYGKTFYTDVCGRIIGQPHSF